MEWSELLFYDETSPSCLRWRVTANNKSARAGDPAGKIVTATSGNKYWKVTLKGRKYYAHRIVFELCSGRKLLPGEIIDHLDGNGLNNVFSNIRVTDMKGNARNRTVGKGIKKSQLPPGVAWAADKHSVRARITDDKNRRVSKNFSLASWGGFEMAVNAAMAWRSFMIETLNRDGAGYTYLHETGGLYV
ncbi:HNH endonuclease [Escherichia coli]|nr:HNH endonuclease [Escherichia coli]MBC1122839.1 HNH endonuclease [Escherichia coli]